jgi:ribosomal protein S1
MIKTTEKDFDFDVFEQEDKPDYDTLVQMYNSYPMLTPEVGQIVEAKYAGIRNDQHIFSVRGFKDDVRIDNRTCESKYLKNIEIGSPVDVQIISVDHHNFYIKGSITEIYENKAHANLKSLDDKTPVIANVKSLNPAGYDVDIIHGGVTLSGFMPNTLAGINKLHDPESIVGDTFQVMIESYSENEGTYIVSRRKYLQSLIPAEIEKLYYDTVYTGHVTGTTQFGVFVEFNGCLTGMIYKSNLSEKWQNRISDIKPGYEIDFYVKEILHEKNNFKIILTQILKETLWDTIDCGQIIEGVVRDSKKFGTLVNLDDETIGLIHTSEMEKINRKFENGERIKVKVLAIDRTSRKIFLTHIK